MNLVWKLLRQHISKSQLTGFFVANLAGMFIVLLSVQVYSDLRPLFSGGESFLNKDYLILTKKINAFTSLAGNGSIFTPEEIEEIIRKLQQEYITRGSHTEAMQSALICQLLVTAARGLEKGQRHNPEEEGLYRDFQALRMEMLRHYEKHWTTEQLCNQINLEKSQFYAYYRQFFHSTPHNDLLQVRLDKAKNLLTNEALPIQQVALSCGFRNMSHFSRYFKQQCGCSPKDWISSVSPQ